MNAYSLFSVRRKLLTKILFNPFLNLKTRWAFLVRLPLIISTSLWKEFHFLQISEDYFIKHLVKTSSHKYYLKFLISSMLLNFWSIWSKIFLLSISQMNPPRKMIQWLTCFSLANSPLEYHELEYHQYVLNKI